MQKTLHSAEETEDYGAALFHSLPSSCLVFLKGELGAGKTTLVRGFLRAAGYQGTVKSPTYTLVEAYHLPNKTIYHFDLYRINNQEELENIGFHDYFSQPAISFIEWPELGGACLPKPDITLSLEAKGSNRIVKLID